MSEMTQEELVEMLTAAALGDADPCQGRYPDFWATLVGDVAEIEHLLGVVEEPDR